MTLYYFVNKSDLIEQIAHWILLFSEFDYKVVYKFGGFHLQADHLLWIFEEESTGRWIDDKILDAILYAVFSVPMWYNHIVEYLST